MIEKKGILLVCISIFLVNLVSAQTYRYIGAGKCKSCHNRSEAGEQYNKWLKDPHSQALKLLSGEVSMDYAKKNGIDDPSKEAKCLKCHSTYEAAGAAYCASILATEGVSCESCHGPGSAYKEIPLMRDQKQAVDNGLLIPDAKLCQKCHNEESPFFKEFNYETSCEKIAHPIINKGQH